MVEGPAAQARTLRRGTAPPSSPRTGRADPAAGLARSWKYDSSRTHLTVTLRPKAEFSNGHHVTSKDVVFSVDQWLKGPAGTAPTTQPHLGRDRARKGQGGLRPQRPVLGDDRLPRPDQLGDRARRLRRPDRHRLLRPSGRRRPVRDPFDRRRRDRPDPQQALLRQDPPLPEPPRLRAWPTPRPRCSGKVQPEQDRPRGGSFPTSDLVKAPRPTCGW